ncbi:hypothetical protein M422DRAFT_53666 [Sphaerobolus stellatus SS14]|uniref:Uncharacterized protein n=1 Tax=Sphaerobolus stellatus (strain SS14) TaxID=990650 RepID=A0A0C9UZU8_SPHS4|nr:hypothetical protein M422DRAFT_53666 [Sphaerobolus stellatus SS14]
MSPTPGQKCKKPATIFSPMSSLKKDLAATQAKLEKIQGKAADKKKSGEKRSATAAALLVSQCVKKKEEDSGNDSGDNAEAAEKGSKATVRCSNFVRLFSLVVNILQMG